MQPKNLIVLFPFKYGNSGFENQIDSLKPYFNELSVYDITNAQKSIAQIINSYNSPNTLFMTFIPGSMTGFKILKELKKQKCNFFIRTHSDLAKEFSTNRWYGKPFEFLINLYVKKQIKGVVNINSGRVLFPELTNQYAVISSSFPKTKIIKKKSSMKEPVNILYVGKLEKKKGVENLLYSLSGLKFKYTLTIIGEGNLRTKLEKLAKNLKVSDKVRFLGYKSFNELEKYYKSADIFVCPSKEEMQGKTWLEALSYGIPVVATDIPGINNYLKDYKNAILAFLHMQTYWLSECMNTLFIDKKLRDKIIKNGYELAKLNSCELMAKEIIKVLKFEKLI